MISFDITDMDSKEIIRQLAYYPKGHLEIKFERVFWVSDYPEPQVPRDYPADSPSNPRGPQPNNTARAFKRMSDTLGSMVC